LGFKGIVGFEFALLFGGIKGSFPDVAWSPLIQTKGREERVSFLPHPMLYKGALVVRQNIGKLYKTPSPYRSGWLVYL